MQFTIITLAGLDFKSWHPNAAPRAEQTVALLRNAD
jgi:hypothetical protein